METIIIAFLIGVAISILCIISFTIGAKVGQKVVLKEDIKFPSPVRAIQDTIATKEREKELERNRIIAENIDNYDGTSLGQKEVPR